MAVGATFGIGVAGANHPGDAPDMTEHADFRIELPAPTNHYSGDVNGENGSIPYFASGADAFVEQNAEEGGFVDWIIVHAEYENTDWIDYSAWDVDNTESFSIDRGNDNEGTNYDEDLVQKQKETTFRGDGITVEFYDWEDLSEDPPYMAPEDAIVAAQGEGSAGGPCLTLTDEPGWYQVQGFMNGTEADDGQGEEPSEDAETAGGTARSNYLYVCECDSEEEAREELGPTPGKTQDGGGDGESGGCEGEEDTEDEAEPDKEAEETPDGETDGESEGEAEDEETPEEVEEPEEEQPEEEPPAEDNETGADEAPGEGATPTAEDVPGFSPMVALVALLGAALLAYRRG